MMLQDRGDLVVATAAIGGGQAGLQEDAMLEFLNSDLVLRWAEVTTLGRAPGLQNGAPRWALAKSAARRVSRFAPSLRWRITLRCMSQELALSRH